MATVDVKRVTNPDPDHQELLEERSRAVYSYLEGKSIASDQLGLVTLLTIGSAYTLFATEYRTATFCAAAAAAALGSCAWRNFDFSRRVSKKLEAIDKKLGVVETPDRIKPLLATSHMGRIRQLKKAAVIASSVGAALAATLLII